MGWASRVNPRSFDQKPNTRGVLDARLQRFASFFGTRAEFDAACDAAKLTETERAYVAQWLPETARES